MWLCPPLLGLSMRLLEAALRLSMLLGLPLLLEVALLLRCSLLLEVTLLLWLVVLLLKVALFLRLRATHRIVRARAIVLRMVSRSSETGACGSRMLKGRLRWMALVLIEELLAVLSSLLVKLSLLCSWRSVPLAHRLGLRERGPEVDAAASAVVAHAVVVVHDHRAVVDVVDVDFVDAVDGAVIEEVVTVPVTAFIAMAAIAEAIVDAAIEADVRAPVSTMEQVPAAEEAPVRRRPERANIGCGNPDAGHPVVAGGSVAPVTGGPEIIRCGSGRLLVLGQRGRRLGGLFCRGWRRHLVIARRCRCKGPSAGWSGSAGDWSLLLVCGRLVRSQTLLLTLIYLLAVGVDGSQVGGGRVWAGVACRVGRRYDRCGAVLFASCNTGQCCQPDHGSKEVGVALLLLNVEHVFISCYSVLLLKHRYLQ